MAVQSDQFSESFDGLATVPALYPVNFPFLEKSDLRVSIKPQDEDEETLLSDDHWSVVPAEDGTAVRVTVNHPETTQVRVHRQTPVLQPHVYQDAQSFELALDRLTMICQELGGGGQAARSIEWAREVWGPEEGLTSETRWAGYTHVGGALASVRLSVNETGNANATVQINVGGQNVFAAPVALDKESETQVFTADDMALAEVGDGLRVNVVVVCPDAGDYSEWLGLQVEFSIEA